MYGMKDDMAGSAALLYMMKNIDEKKLECNVVCALAVAENSIA
jgi:leucyl aminopeptidase